MINTPSLRAGSCLRPAVMPPATLSIPAWLCVIHHLAHSSTPPYTLSDQVLSSVPTLIALAAASRALRGSLSSAFSHVHIKHLQSVSSLIPLVRIVGQGICSLTVNDGGEGLANEFTAADLSALLRYSSPLTNLRLDFPSQSLPLHLLTYAITLSPGLLSLHLPQPAHENLSALSATSTFFYALQNLRPSRYLETLALDCAIPPTSLPHLQHIFPSLTTLAVVNRDPVSPLARELTFPHLRRLVLINGGLATNIVARNLATLTRGCPRLRALGFGGLGKEDESSFVEMVETLGDKEVKVTCFDGKPTVGMLMAMRGGGVKLEVFAMDDTYLSSSNSFLVSSLLLSNARTLRAFHVRHASSSPSFSLSCLVPYLHPAALTLHTLSLHSQPAAVTGSVLGYILRAAGSQLTYLGVHHGQIPLSEVLSIAAACSPRAKVVAGD